jgi:hypothetical protein
MTPLTIEQSASVWAQAAEVVDRARAAQVEGLAGSAPLGDGPHRIWVDVFPSGRCWVTGADRQIRTVRDTSQAVEVVAELLAQQLGSTTFAEVSADLERELEDEVSMEAQAEAYARRVGVHRG